MIELWTDGSCKNNGKDNPRGGWAFIFKSEDNEEYWAYGSNNEKNVTNNIMEIKAILYGLNFIKSQNIAPNIIVNVYSDSANILNCYKQQWYKTWIKNGWKTANKKPVKNKELWEELIKYFDMPNIHFNKVPGHCGVQYNEYVDSMAQCAAQELRYNNLAFNTKENETKPIFHKVR